MNEEEQIVSILERVLNEDINGKQALALWPNFDTKNKPVFSKAWHNLYHFSVDTDIQDKDTEYKKYQLGLIQSDLYTIKRNSL